jgi:CRP-like cAMP-binding protein/predicted MFS family arabinose efflux permease
MGLSDRRLDGARRQLRDFGSGALDTVVGLMSMGNRAYSVAVVAVLYEGTHSASLVAVAAAVRYLAGLAASVLTIPFLGRIGPRRLLIGGNLLCFVVALVLSAEAGRGASSTIVIVLSGVLRATTAPAPIATAEILPRVLGGRDLADARRRQNVVDKLALLIGPALGGVLLLTISAATELAVVAWLFAVAAVVSVMLPEVRQPSMIPSPAPAAAPVTEAVVGDRTRRVGPVLWFSGFTVAAGLLYGLDTVLFAVVASDRLGLGGDGYGLLFAGLGVGGALAALVAKRAARQPSLALPLVGALCLYAFPTAALPWVSNVGVAMSIEAVRGFGSLVVEVLAVTGIQRVLLPSRIPEVVARVSAGVAGAVAAGALLTPLLLSAFGLRDTLFLASTVIPGCTLLTLPWLARVDRGVQANSIRLAPRTRVLARLGLLAGVSIPTLEMLAGSLREMDVPAATVLVREGETSDAFYVIVTGRAVATASDGRELRTMGEGEWFGEIAALTGIPRTATVTATAPTHLYEISSEDFQQALLQLAPSTTLLDSAAARLRATHPERSLFNEESYRR